MFRRLSSRLAAGAAAVILAAGAFAPAAYAQSGAFQFGAVVEVAPGTRQCIANPMLGYYNVTAEDFVMFGAPVKFTLQGGFTLASTGYPDYSFYARFDRPTGPSFFQIFPGYFRTCARNDSTEYSTVYLSVTVDQ